MSKGKPFEQWLWSNKNFAGCILALGGPVLAVSGLVAPPIALALIPVLYAAGALAAPGNKKVDLAGNVDAKNVTQSLNTIRKAVKGKVAASVEQRVENICTTVHTLLPSGDKAGSEETFVLTHTATDYLPGALEPYLALPRFYAEHRPLSDGRTAEVALCEQLDIMSERLDDVADAIMKSDSDKLLANGKFLQNKFGTNPLSLPEQP